MRSVAIIQARMGSTRLPGKILKELQGKTVLAHVVDRVKAIVGINEVVIATTTQPEDDLIATEARLLDVALYRGSETDVLTRYYEAAKGSKADVILRITSDCPLLDPNVSAYILHHFKSAAKVDYVSNTLERSYPRGLDTEVFTFSALQISHDESQEPYHREHVTPFIYENQQRFRCESVRFEQDYSHYRWTLDTPEDWELIQKMYEELYVPGKLFSWIEAKSFMSENPHLVKINENVVQKGK
ncbi:MULTISPECIES: cytidylyltransferase domain-containing protein [Brevibacillus]|uniref:cytidylyltransferase domain-containing protein n=1 Tax=Brevibacillus TaxID=55080 RepID=UPI000271C3BD|nr:MULTISPECIES: glycosyltransferase family protein [Brevibacillus]EJL46887.1 spore coat polysaccharide biosynthesis protein F, CMP-KDO synthetase [Brevibacillus sp. CF112]MED1822657.1 glycosyltransferase family protein [Brevibacillus agri]